MDKVKKYLPLVITLLGALAPVISPVVEGFYSKHPEGVALLAGAWASLKWLLPSPIKSNA
jgi:hypothetical protein